MRLLLVGAGAWGSTWTGVVAAAAGWELSGIVDVDEEVLERVGSRAGVAPARRFTSVAAAVERCSPRAALVAVPPALHAQVALEVLDCGLHCVVEKPFATTLDDARAVVERARRLGLVVMAGQNYRFRRGARTVARLVRAGTIGRVGSLEIRFQRSPVFSGYRLEMDEPLLLDMAVHHFDQVRALLGSDVAAVSAQSFNPPWSPFRGNAAAFARLSMRNGVAVAYSGSYAARGKQTGWDGEWELQGELGSIRWVGDSVLVRPCEPERRRRRRLLRRRAGRSVPLVEMEAEDRAALLAELAAAVRERREPEACGRDNLGTLAAVLAAVESARSGRTVELPG